MAFISAQSTPLPTYSGEVQEEGGASSVSGNFDLDIDKKKNPKTNAPKNDDYVQQDEKKVWNTNDNTDTGSGVSGLAPHAIQQHYNPSSKPIEVPEPTIAPIELPEPVDLPEPIEVPDTKPVIKTAFETGQIQDAFNDTADGLKEFGDAWMSYHEKADSEYNLTHGPLAVNSDTADTIIKGTQVLGGFELGTLGAAYALPTAIEAGNSMLTNAAVSKVAQISANQFAQKAATKASFDVIKGGLNSVARSGATKAAGFTLGAMSLDDLINGYNSKD